MGDNQAMSKHQGKFSADDIHSLSQQINILCIQDNHRISFLTRVTRMLLSHSRCDSINIWFREGSGFLTVESSITNAEKVRIENVPVMFVPSHWARNSIAMRSNLNDICRRVLHEAHPENGLNVTPYGSAWAGDVTAQLPGYHDKDAQRSPDFTSCDRFLAIIPVRIGKLRTGVMLLSAEEPNVLDEQDILYFEDIAETLGIAFNHIQTQTALSERIKELTCLYGISKIGEDPDLDLPTMLHHIVELIPPGWQYPEYTMARILLDGDEYRTQVFKETAFMQEAAIAVGGRKRGKVEVYYGHTFPELDEGPFLKEERNLINAVARQIGNLVERQEAEEEKRVLEEQLLHSDRLATIGQLAAGVAHEINEPLGNILGFAQLAQQNENNPPQTGQDLEKIVNASLHAREVIRKLLVFSRQVPKKKTLLQFNEVIEDSLYFFESRFIKSGIQIVKDYTEGLPRLAADPTQISQVVINLIVNALHAMSSGGTLTLRTFRQDGYLVLQIIDTGIGMSDEVRSKMFLPFFTTKDVNEGTGLGLAVVHGIVTSHDGLIEVRSELDEGTEVDVRFPLIDEPEGEE